MLNSINLLILSAVVPLIVMSVTLLVQYRYRRCDKKAEIVNLAKVLAVEIESFIKIYEPYRLPEIPPEDVRDLDICEAVNDNNVYVFTHSVHQIGVFALEDVRTIVNFYVKLKALIDSTENLYMKIGILKMFADDETKAKNGLSDSNTVSLYEKIRFHDVEVFKAKDEVLAILSRYQSL